MDGSDPRLVGGGVNPAALSGTSGMSVPLMDSATLKARAYSGGVWSALSEATFIVSGEGEAGFWQMQ